MKAVDYKLPSGLHPKLDPVEISRKPGKVNPKKPDEPVKDVVEYQYNVVPIRRAESIEEFTTSLVEQDDTEKHKLALLNQQRSLLAQRIVRERAESKEVAEMFEGKFPGTENLDEAGRKAFVIADLIATEQAWLYNSKPAATGGVTAQAKAALEREQAIAKAASENKEIAQLQAKLAAKLAAMGINV